MDILLYIPTQVERGIINLAGAKVQYSEEMKLTSAVSPSYIVCPFHTTSYYPED